jgi:hypothetical protein
VKLDQRGSQNMLIFVLRNCWISACFKQTAYHIPSKRSSFLVGYNMMVLVSVGRCAPLTFPVKHDRVRVSLRLHSAGLQQIGIHKIRLIRCSVGTNLQCPHQIQLAALQYDTPHEATYTEDTGIRPVHPIDEIPGQTAGNIVQL